MVELTNHVHYYIKIHKLIIFYFKINLFNILIEMWILLFTLLVVIKSLNIRK